MVKLFVFRRRARLEHKDSVVPDKVLPRCKRRVVLFFSVSRLKARRLGGFERGAEGVFCLLRAQSFRTREAQYFGTSEALLQVLEALPTPEGQRGIA